MSWIPQYVRTPQQKPRIVTNEERTEADKRTMEAIEAEHVRQRDAVLRELYGEVQHGQ